MQLSLSVLRYKVSATLQFLRGLEQSGRSDPKFLRLVNKLCALLRSNPPSNHLDDEVLQCLSMVYASLTTKNIALLNDLSDKYMATYSRRSTQF